MSNIQILLFAYPTEIQIMKQFINITVLVHYFEKVLFKNQLE